MSDRARSAAILWILTQGRVEADARRSWWMTLSQVARPEPSHFIPAASAKAVSPGAALAGLDNEPRVSTSPGPHPVAIMNPAAARLRRRRRDAWLRIGPPRHRPDRSAVERVLRLRLLGRQPVRSKVACTALSGERHDIPQDRDRTASRSFRIPISGIPPPALTCRSGSLVRTCNSCRCRSACSGHSVGWSWSCHFSSAHVARRPLYEPVRRRA